MTADKTERRLCLLWIKLVTFALHSYASLYDFTDIKCSAEVVTLKWPKAFLAKLPDLFSFVFSERLYSALILKPCLALHYSTTPQYAETAEGSREYIYTVATDAMAQCFGSLAVLYDVCTVKERSLDISRPAWWISMHERPAGTTTRSPNAAAILEMEGEKLRAGLNYE